MLLIELALFTIEHDLPTPTTELYGLQLSPVIIIYHEINCMSYRAFYREWATVQMARTIIIRRFCVILHL